MTPVEATPPLKLTIKASQTDGNPQVTGAATGQKNGGNNPGSQNQGNAPASVLVLTHQDGSDNQGDTPTPTPIPALEIGSQTVAAGQ